MLFLNVRHLASRVAIFVGSTASGFMYFMTVTHIQLLRLQDGLEVVWNSMRGMLVTRCADNESLTINLLVVYRESVNLIGYITRRLSADSLQL